MGTELVIRKAQDAIMERVIITGDLSELTPAERVAYYMRTCESIGLNPLTKPFDYIKLSGKLTLYARKDATEQLRKNHKISITGLDKEMVGDGVYVVTAHARDGEGREDIDTGVVSVKGISGEALANAYMKAITKAKRRVTLSICGLGFLDESELETIPDARPVIVDDTGTIRGEITPSRTITTGDPLKDENQERERSERQEQARQAAIESIALPIKMPKTNGHKVSRDDYVKRLTQVIDKAQALGVDAGSYVVTPETTIEQITKWGIELTTAITEKMDEADKIVDAIPAL